MSNKNSNFPNAQQPDLKDGEMRKNISFMLQFYNMPKARTPEEIRSRIDQMFSLCMETETRPTVELLCLALKVTRQTLLDWQKAGEERGEIVTLAKQVLAALTDNWGMSGKLNPAAYCFNMKNNWGYCDTISIKAEESKEITPEISASDIAARHQIGQPMKRPELPADLLE